MMYREIIAVCAETYKNHTILGQTTKHVEMQPGHIYSRLTNGLIQHLTKNLNQCAYQRHARFDGTVGRKETLPFYNTQNLHGYTVHQRYQSFVVQLMHIHSLLKQLKL